MNRSLFAVLTMTLLVLLLGSLLAACGGAKNETAVPTTEQQGATPVTLDGKSLLGERCTKCHDLGRVEKAKRRKKSGKQRLSAWWGKAPSSTRQNKKWLSSIWQRHIPNSLSVGSFLR